MPLRAAIYIRESTEEQGKGFSPDNQERVIREYAHKQGMAVIDDVYKDLISGKYANKREDFLRMISDAEEKKFDIILVYHTSRFARNVKEARGYKELLREKLGIDVVSVTQQFGNWNQPSSFLNEGINELFDDHYSKQLSFWVRGALQEKRKQGLPIGQPPVGYYKKKLGFDEDQNRTIYAKEWLIEPKEAQVVREMFEDYSSGKYSFADIAETANKKGVKTKSGNPFTYSSVKDILRNKTYLGYITSPRRGYVEIPGKHTPIIDETLFNKVQDTIAARKNTQGRPVAQHRLYLLQGVLFCERCKKHLKDKINNSTHTKMLPKMYCEARRDGEFYCCKFKREYRNCVQKDVLSEKIDKQVLEFMSGLIIPKDIQDLILSDLEKMMNEEKETAQSPNEYKRLIARKEKLNLMYLEMGELNDEEYKEKIAKINQELKKHTPKNSEAGKSDNKAYLAKTKKFLSEFKTMWLDSGMDKEEQRAWILLTIKRVWIKNDQVVAIEPHDDFTFLFKSCIKVFGQPPLVTPVWAFT